MSATTNRSLGGTEGAVGARRPLAPPPDAAAGRQRRRPLVIGLGVALTALGALGAAYLATTTTHAQAVLVVARPLTAGDALSAADLAVAYVNPDPNLRTVPASRKEEVLNQHVAVSLLPGQVLTPETLTAGFLPKPGYALVGVPLTALQVPAQPISPGETIEIVDTDTPGASGSKATTFRVRVVSIRSVPDTDKTVIDVLVPDTDAASLVSVIAGGHLGVALLNNDPQAPAASGGSPAPGATPAPSEAG